MGAYSEAKDYFAQALTLAMEIRAVQVALDIFIGIANLFLKQGGKDRALELLAFVIHQSDDSRERKNRAEVLVPECEAGLSAQVVMQCRVWGQKQVLVDVVTTTIRSL
jgi:hypothetical protein